MIVATVGITPSPNRRNEVLEILQAIRGPVAAQPQCVACQVCEELSPGRAVVLIERWESEAALAAHLRSESFRRILAAVELSCSAPEIRFDLVSHSEGMELITRWRSPFPPADGDFANHGASSIGGGTLGRSGEKEGDGS